jgi:signal transduction histidine kinase
MGHGSSSTEAASDPQVRAALSLLAQPAWRCDERGRIADANDAWRAFVGELSALRTWWLSDRLVHPWDIDAAREAWRRALASDEAQRIELRLRRFDGAWRWQVLQLSPVHRPNGEGLRAGSWIGTFTDIDASSGPQAELVRDQQLERMRSEIVATVGHELRTPLTSIYGMAVTLRSRHGELAPSVRRELLDVIIEQSSRMGRTIDDFLAAWRLEHRQLAVRRAACDLVKIARNVVASATAADPRHLVVLLDDSPTSIVVDADPQRLRQVLGNIVENAVKYSANDDAVQVRIRRDGRSAFVDVDDHGPGIPIDEQGHVFDRFHRLDPGLVNGVPGSGLGLYIARELARRMGGDVTVRSTPGAGACFTLRLPVPAGAAAPRQTL